MISILMPFKNEAKYLGPCLDSIRRQSFPNWQLIAVDDHSTDDSWEIIQTVAQTDKRITVIKNEAAGVIAALDTGYKRANNSIITRMDADDLMPQRKLELMYELLQKKGPGFVVTGFVEYFSEQALGNGYLQYQKWLNNLTRSEKNFNEIYKECPIASPAWLMYKNDLDRIGGINSTQLPEDYDLAFRMKAGQLKIAAVPDVIHLWRDHPLRSSRNLSYLLDNSFLSLKTGYFLTLDHNSSKRLFVWGAGTKGKKIAKLLLGSNVSFEWLCENKNKSGQNIYGKILLNPRSINLDNSQIIVAIANKIEQQKVANYIGNRESEIYYFC